MLHVDSVFFFFFFMNVKKKRGLGDVLKEMIIHAFETERHAVACLMQET